MHAHEEREREENTNVSSAFERKTTSAKEKREQRDAKKFKRDRAKRAKSDPILSVFIKLLQRRRRKKRNETKRAHLVQQNVRVFRRERERCNHRRSEDAKE